MRVCRYEERFGIKVLGVVPFKPFNLGFEDSASLMGYKQNTNRAIIKVAVIKLPHISNFTDFEPLVVDEEIELTFITNAAEASAADLLIIPGSKRVVDDLLWLKERGFEKRLSNKEKKIVAICGGYEMLFETILDPLHIESEYDVMQGLGRFKGSVTFQKEKRVKKGCYNIWGIMANGYEIHNAIAKKNAKHKRNLYATFVHGIFENDALRLKLFRKINTNYKGYNFKEFKVNSIEDFTNHIEKHIDMQIIEKSLYE